MSAYFAYGSNMCSAQMEQRCPGAVARGIARLVGHRFLINERGVATITPEQTASVFGVLWDITEPHEAELDRCEGVAEGRYTRQFIDVELASRQIVRALVYQDPRNEDGSPRQGYLPIVLEGAREHRLPEEYQAELARWAAD